MLIIDVAPVAVVATPCDLAYTRLRQCLASEGRASTGDESRWNIRKRLQLRFQTIALATHLGIT